MRKKGDKGAPTPEQLKKAKDKTAKAEYEMTDEEFAEVMSVEELVLYKNSDTEETEAAKKRPGRNQEHKLQQSRAKKKVPVKIKKAVLKRRRKNKFLREGANLTKNKVKSITGNTKESNIGNEKVYRRGAGAFLKVIAPE